MNTPGWDPSRKMWVYPNEPASDCPPEGCNAECNEPEDDHAGDFETPPGALDRVPSHYQGSGLSPFEVIDAFNLDFYEGNAIKYLLRWRRKGGVNDLEKAKHYIDELIRRAGG